jgi:putative nucleotidyltransferase with HDIG domain
MKKSQNRTQVPDEDRTPLGSEREPDAAASAPPVGDRLRVLLVDDHPSVLRFLTFAFSSKGCDVAGAASAEKALELIGRETFGLVVSDIKMPGLSGLDVLQAVKSQQPATPVVLITGSPSVETAVFSLRHQAFDYLTKPFSVEEVQELLARVRKERESREELLRAPVRVTKELARRQHGMEVLSRIGSLALQRLDIATFLEQVLEQSLESLGCDAAVILLADDFAQAPPTEKGEPALVEALVDLSRRWLEEAGSDPHPDAPGLIATTEPFGAMGALIPGDRKPMGILSLARARETHLLPDEKEFLVAYARTVAVALQRIFLGENLEENLIDTIAAFVNALESKDPYLKGHSARVSLYAGEIARAMGLSPAQVGLVRRAGILHDLGKLVVLDAILQKPARLTPEEFTLMQGHPVNAAKILKPLRFLSQEAEAIKRHHERYDGKGYPDGLRGGQIPLPARIVTVADSFDAMTSNRPYRAAMPLETAIAEILRHAGAQFDPAVTEAFTRVPLARLNEISRFYDNQPGVAESAPAKALPEAPENGTSNSLDALAAAWTRLAAVNGLAPGKDIASQMRRTQTPSA